MSTRVWICAVLVCALGSVCAGQVLYEAANSSRGGGEGSSSGDAEAGESRAPEMPPSLDSVSLIAVEPPVPVSFEPNDLITIIISERTRTTREQEVESEKDYDFGGRIPTWIDMMKLLELRVEQGDRSPVGEWALQFTNEFEAEASYERDDTVTSRVTARVVEVKPNGTLLLEARTAVRTDTEEQTIVLSGLCRTEDVTDANTVQSNQMYDLGLDIQTTGDVSNGAKKGVIPKVLETIFNF